MLDGERRDGDEVVLPSFTHASVANAVLSLGARPVFAETLNAYLVDVDEDVDEAEDRLGTAAVEDELARARGVAQISHVVRFESLEKVQAAQGQR